MPVAAFGLALALISGMMLFSVRGGAYIAYPAFQLKTLILAAGLVNVFAFRPPSYIDAQGTKPMKQTRRTVLQSLLAAPPAMIFTGSSAHVWAQLSALPLTPACETGSVSTPQQTQGPFYRPNAPQRNDLTADAGSRRRFSLRGFVFDTGCRPVPEAMVEIWHADERGEYDNDGYRWRAYQLTDDAGRWGFDTILTQHYSFRTAHYHIRVQPRGGEVLTTQLYFPDHPRNHGDRLFDPRLVMALDDDRSTGRFDFVVPSL
ncbi:dioxygenase family protein [Sinorhizobium meliloti]|uniref:dioxygenase family protein n=2 Tax=Rhizobium meliloti TaxID=382 RepID=UPI001F44167E|nr:catechol 1,2-dioxygenase [Sinorhizobium meliloti]